jgi:hypothetical protein
MNRCDEIECGNKFHYKGKGQPITCTSNTFNGRHHWGYRGKTKDIKDVDLPTHYLRKVK